MSLLIVVPPILFPAWIIVWHLILIFKLKTSSRPNTISAHAEVKPKLLVLHQLSHALPAIAVLPFAYGFLLHNKYELAAFLLVNAAIFDAVEVLSLRRTANESSWLGSSGAFHKITASLMALLYLSYTVVISRIAVVDDGLYILVCILVLSTLAIFFIKRFSAKQHFFILQMFFFMIVTLVMLIAHVKLLSEAY